MTQELFHPTSAPAAPLCADLTEDQIQLAAGALQKIRPAYGPIIEFYSRVFKAQASSMADIRLDPIMIQPDLLALKSENEMPLITPAQFRIDIEAARVLMKKICGLATAYAPKLATAGETLGQALETDKLDLAALFTALLDGMDVQETADSLDIPGDVLALFGFLTMAPSIQTCAAQLLPYLEDMPQRSRASRGYCPVCGSCPDLAAFDESGKKHASCSLCAHIWTIPRMGCLFCDSTDKEDQHYFFTGEEAEYRVYCCDSCRRYIKTVDTRKLGRKFFPKLERIATIHLDMKAKEQGYNSPAQDTDMT